MAAAYLCKFLCILTKLVSGRYGTGPSGLKDLIFQRRLYFVFYARAGAGGKGQCAEILQPALGCPHSSRPEVLPNIFQNLWQYLDQNMQVDIWSDMGVAVLAALTNGIVETLDGNGKKWEMKEMVVGLVPGTSESKNGEWIACNLSNAIAEPGVFFPHVKTLLFTQKNTLIQSLH